MKQYYCMKKRFCLACSLALLIALLSLPMSVRAEDGIVVCSIYHKHIAGCEKIVYKTMNADGYSGSYISGTDTCALCGGQHHYYQAVGSCSCGQTFSANGHACINSMYGTNRGSCPNYSVLSLNTSHSHPVSEYACGKTEETVIGTVKVQKDNELPAQSVTLSATAEGEMDSIALSWGSLAEGSELTVTENGTYTLYITYSENGIEYMTDLNIEINNIDHDAPVLGDIEVSRTEFTSENIIIKVTPQDAFGLPQDCISWNGEAFGEAREYEVQENGSYEVIVKDYAGNTVSGMVEIHNIDKTPPEIKGIQVWPAPWYDGECTVKVEAQDLGNGNEGSGLAKNAFSFDGGENWSENNSISLEQPGSITVQVRDNVGNISERTFEVSYDTRPAPVQGGNGQSAPTQPLEVTQESLSTQQDVIAERENTGKHEEAAEVYGESEPSDGEEMSMETENVFVEMEEYQTENDAGTLQIMEENKKTFVSMKGILLTICILLGTGLLAGIGMILFLLFGLCRIYETDYNGKERFLGSVGIRFGEKGYTACIGASLIRKAKSRELKMKIPSWFVQCAKYRLLKIKVGNQILEKYVEKEVSFHVRM